MIVLKAVPHRLWGRADLQSSVTFLEGVSYSEEWVAVHSRWEIHRDSVKGRTTLPVRRRFYRSRVPLTCSLGRCATLSDRKGFDHSQAPMTW